MDPAVNDVAGMVAYGLYKKDKREWMIRFRTERNRAPNVDEIVDYTLGWNDVRIESSKNTAQSVLANFAAYVLAREEPKIIKDALRGRFWDALGLGLIVNLVYTAALLIVVASLGSQGIDLIDIYREFAEPPVAAPQP
ncbi:MAG: hypothetical protein H7124_12280 [Phycisphaerales bacterium]|nr:hypothetical protein [Hyphomonadaceae bacterium]